ncbi:MAG: thymidine kinase [bacterium]
MAKLYFYYSTMNAGKTTALLQSRYNYHERGMNTLTILPAFDTRAGVGVIKSRVGLQCPAHSFTQKDNILKMVDALHSLKAIHCVFVDESQFLTKQQVYELGEVVDTLKIPVLAYGLRTDFQGELFEGSHYLLAWADELKEIKTICHSGKKATMVVRIDEQGHAVSHGNQIEIGGNDRYISVSRSEFKRIMNDGGQVPHIQSKLEF